jgi:hypothetical protein
MAGPITVGIRKESPSGRSGLPVDDVLAGESIRWRRTGAARLASSFGHKRKWLLYLIDTAAGYLVRRGGLVLLYPIEST